MDVDPTISAIYDALDLTGVVLNGIIGGTIARTMRFDIIGFSFLAIISALGGGMLRDTLIQGGTPAAIANPLYLGMAILGALIAAMSHLEGRRVWRTVKLYGDSLVLGVWAVTGTMKALIFGMPWPSAILLGAITSVGGGMIRDVCIGRTPAIFGGSSLYATSALAASATLVFFDTLGHNALGMIVAALLGAAMTIISALKGWQLPVFSDEDPPLRQIVRERAKRGITVPMSINDTERQQTAAELRELRTRIPISDKTLCSYLDYSTAKFYDVLNLENPVEPAEVWRMRDFLVAVAKETGTEVPHFSTLRNRMRPMARMWFGRWEIPDVTGIASHDEHGDTGP